MPPKKKTAAAQGYKHAEPIPLNTTFEDILKKRWRLGPSIGKGGFGEIYSAAEEGTKNYCYVAKIEPHTNGPLFVEINFYIRYAKPAHVAAFQQKRGLKTFGLPVYCGSGSIFHKGEKYRFLVIEKFASDLSKLFIEKNHIFPTDTVFKIGIQIMDVLEYIHECGYVHADIKPANILLGSTKETENKQVYLVDFGLACKYSVTKEFKPNPHKEHDGTIEYTSRDAHRGVPTRRGDLEILAYNLLQWLGCTLPWKDYLDSKLQVLDLKEKYMASASKMIKACFGTKKHPKAIMDYLVYLQTLQYDSDPDYNRIREIFTSGVTEGGGSIGTSLTFSVGRTPSKKGGRDPNNSGINKAKKTNQQLKHPSGDEIPKSSMRRKQIATTQEEEKDADDANSDQTDDDEDIHLMPKSPVQRKKTGDKKISVCSPKRKNPRRKQDADQDDKDKTDIVPKLGKRGRVQTNGDVDNTDFKPKRGMKQTASKDDNNENDLMSKQGRKLTANKDDDDDWMLEPAKRGRKQTGNKDDEDDNGSRKAGRENELIAIKSGRLRRKGILNLENGLEQDNDASGTKPKETRKYEHRRSLSSDELSGPIADPFEGYTSAMKEIKLKKIEKEKTNKKKPAKKY